MRLERDYLGGLLRPYNSQRTTIQEWYSGPTLWEVMSSLPEPKRNTSAPLRMTIFTFLIHRKLGAIVIGRIIRGILRPGDRVVLTPTLYSIADKEKEGGELIAVSIQKNGKPLDKAIPGDIGMYLLPSNTRLFL